MRGAMEPPESVWACLVARRRGARYCSRRIPLEADLAELLQRASALRRLGPGMVIQGHPDYEPERIEVWHGDTTIFGGQDLLRDRDALVEMLFDHGGLGLDRRDTRFTVTAHRLSFSGKAATGWVARDMGIRLGPEGRPAGNLALRAGTGIRGCADLLGRDFGLMGLAGGSRNPRLRASGAAARLPLVRLATLCAARRLLVAVCVRVAWIAARGRKRGRAEMGERVCFKKQR